MNSLSRIGIYLCKSENHDKDLRLAIAPNQYDFNKLSSSIFRWTTIYSVLNQASFLTDNNVSVINN